MIAPFLRRGLRSIAGVGNGTRSDNFVEMTASAKPAVTTRTRVAKSAISLMGRNDDQGRRLGPD
jgi:hypothetical protein